MTEFEFRLIVDLFFLSAMGMPGGGRSIISNRLVRHSNVMAYTNMEDSSILAIFKNIVQGFYQNHEAEVTGKIDQVVETTLHCYNEAVKFLLPIPKKSHYLFNLRDISKVFQGVCNGKPQIINEPNIFIRLWIHEMNRVFRDRLLDKRDMTDFNNLVDQSIKEKIPSVDITKVFDREVILFGDFIDKDPDNRIYKEIESLKKLEVIL